MPLSAPSPATAYFRPYLGVIYDLDGTLVDSRLDFSRMRKAVIELAGRSGVPPGELHPTMSVPHLLGYARDRLQQLGLPPGVYLRLEAEVNRRLDELEVEALEGVTLVPDAREHLGRMREAGFRLGVLTRSSEAFTRGALKREGVLELFDRLRTRSDSGPVKPDPESLRILLTDMGVPRERAVYVGDMPADLECASGAGVDFIAFVGSGPGAGTQEEELRRKGARRIAHGMLELHREITGRALREPTPTGASR
jgi:HAD superfamily hydrolase (TIGR01549 family)